MLEGVQNFIQPFTRNLSGYICITRANRSDQDEETNKGWSDSHNYYLKVTDGQADWSEIERDIEVEPDYLEWEWYFTPAVFSRPRRRLEDFKASNALWLDFDTETYWNDFDPEPTFVVQSRPGPSDHPDRLQAFWILDEPITDQFELRHLNRTAFHYFGCDDESCVTPQHLMKLPFGRNLKLAAYLAEGEYWAPRLLQTSAQIWNAAEFRAMPEPPEATVSRSGEMIVPDTLPDTQDKSWREWLNEFKGRIPKGLDERIRTAPPPGEITRSENLYGIIASLLDYLVPEDIFRCIVGSPNDKFSAKHGSVRGPVYLWSDIHRIWDKTSSGKPESDLILPDEFWESRSFLKIIRQAAHSRCTSADTVLACVLARLSSMVDHRVHLDTGLGRSPLNMFCILLGATGVGKGASMKAAEDILRLPVSFVTSQGTAYIDGAAVGSGEGIAEAYIGQVSEAGPDGKKTLVRKQVRHNAYLVADEGKAFATQAARKGSTLVPTVCSAWSGSTLGQMNATSERTRHVPGNSYSLGLAIGFQEATVLPILDEIDTGLPQRFLWLHCLDPNIPEEPVDEPMLPLGGVLTSAPNQTITFAESIRQELWNVRRQRSAGTLEIPVERSQEPLMLCKVSGLLALLDGRSHVDETDWELANELWEASLKVMDSAWGYHKKMAAKKKWEMQSSAVELETVKEVARNTAMSAMERCARLLAKQFQSNHRMTQGILRSKLSPKDRILFDQAVQYAIDAGWIIKSETKAYVKGPVTPDEH